MKLQKIYSLFINSKTVALGLYATKFFLIFLIIIFSVACIYMSYSYYFGSVAKLREQIYAQQSLYEKMMQADIYGGETPEITLKIFVDALENKNFTLAGKYFVLDTNINSRYYLSGKGWEVGLRKIYDENKIDELVYRVKNSKYDRGFSSPALSTAIFTFYDDNKHIEYNISLELNQYSGAWKISGL